MDFYCIYVYCFNIYWHSFILTLICFLNKFVYLTLVVSYTLIIINKIFDSYFFSYKKGDQFQIAIFPQNLVNFSLL